MGKFKTLGTAVSDLENAAKDRLADAKILAAAGRSASAISAGLYAIEILLKVLICKKLDLQQLPIAFQIHELDELLLLAGLSQAIYDPNLVKIQANWNEILTLSLSINELRYSPDQKWSGQLPTFMRWLEDPNDGVLTWLLSQK